MVLTLAGSTPLALLVRRSSEFTAMLVTAKPWMVVGARLVSRRFGYWSLQSNQIRLVLDHRLKNGTWDTLI